MGCLLGFPDQFVLLLGRRLGTAAAAAPEAREAKHGEEPQRP